MIGFGNGSANFSGVPCTNCIQLDPLDPMGTNADLVALARVDEIERGDVYRASLEGHGFEHFAPEGFRSQTLTTVANNRDIDVPAFVKAVRQKHDFLINGGYGKIKGKTFRISNMGNETEETMQELLTALDDVLPEFV